jgi:hypothetical protein
MFWRKMDTRLSCSWLEDLGPWPWTLAAGSVVEVCADRIEAEAFLRKHGRRSTPRVILGPLKPGTLELKFTRWAGVEIPASARAAIERKDAWFEPPHLWIEKDGRGVAAWRLLLPEFSKPAEVESAIGAWTARWGSECGGTCKPVLVDMPVPEIGARPWTWVHSRGKGKEIHHSKIIRTPIKPKTAADDEDEEAFVRGDQARVKKPPMLKAGWIPAEAFTLFVGRPKRGKSLAVAKMASYITAGGVWFDGEPVAPEARGSVLIIEEEDSRAETLARCKAAGCDMSRVHVRVKVPDISNPAQLKKVTDFAESLGDCRMISFSPLQSAIPSADMNEAVVRAKLRPILSWSRGKRVALVGVIHLDKEGKHVAGSDVIVRACRSGLSFDDHPDDKREDEFSRRRVMRIMLSNVGRMGSMVPYDTEGETVTIGGEEIPTAKIVFRSPQTSTVAGVEGLAAASPLPSPSAASEAPPRRYTDTQLRYVKWLSALIPPLVAGGVPMEGSTVRRLARENGFGSIENLYDAARVLGIELRKTGPANAPDLWMPASELPAEIEGLLARA